MDSSSADTDCARVVGGGCSLLVRTPDPPRCETGAPPDTGDTSDGQVVGSGLCASTAGPTWIGWLCVVAVLLRRRAWPLLLLLAIPRAHAQDTDVVGVNAQLLRTLDGGPFPSLWEPELGGRWDLEAAFAVNHAWGLARLITDEGETEWLRKVSTEEIGVSIRIADAVRVGASFPSHTRIRFDEGWWEAAPGDLAVWAAVPLREAPKRLHLASIVRIDVPTGTPELYLGDPDGSVRGGVAASGMLAGWEGLANLGVRLSLPTALPGMDWGSRLEGGLGLRHGMWGTTWAAFELTGSIGLPPQPSPGDRPVEALGHVGAVVWKGVGVSLGGGAGLTAGLGSPSGRIVGMLDARPRPGDDRDGDGIVDRKDGCVTIPEDADGLLDGDGCPEDDADGDRIFDAVDQCPLDPETENGWADADGCPDAISTTRITVLSADPAVPLERAQVTLDGDAVEVIGGDPVELVRPPGELVIHATADGFHPGDATFHVPPGVVVPLVVTLEPIRYGEVRVRLEDEGGHPLAGWVRAGGGPTLVSAEGWSVRAPVGPYTLRASALGRRSREVTVEVPRDGTVTAVVALAPSGVRQDGTRITTDQEIRFPLDSAEPTPDSLPVFDDIAALLLGDPSIQLLRVEGHADAAGSSRYNLDLSRKRAEAVRARLVTLGVAPERLEAIGSGESVATAGPVRAVTFTVLVWGEE